MRLGTIVQLSRYPVKSMEGENLVSALLTKRGIAGDRGWAVFDETRGGVTNAKRLPQLRACRARYVAEPAPGAASPPVEIALPNGRTVQTAHPDAPRQLSSWLDRAVSLRPLGPVGSQAAPRVTAAGDPPEMLRAMMGLLPDEPEADMSAFPIERLRALRHGNFFDALPVHLLTRTTLRTLARIAPESAWDERRFRCNLLIEADADEGYPEQEWIGRRIRVGSAVLEVVTGCPRCVMVTQATNGLPADTRIMRTLVRETRHIAGLYAQVITEGILRPGDEVSLVG